MLSLVLTLALAQTQPAIRRTTPAVDDPGMVVRQTGTVNVNCTSGCSGGSGGGWTPDGGNIGSVNQGAGQDGGAWNVAGSVNVTNASLAVTGPLTDAELRATPVPVSGTVTANAGTGPWPVTDNGGSLTVDGTVAVSSVAGNVTVVQGTGSNLHVAVDSMPSTTVSGTVTSNQGTANTTANRWPVQLTDGTDLSLISAAGALLIDGSATTQPVSGTVAATQSGGWTVTANAGTNLNTSALFLDATFTGRFMAAASLADNTSNPTTTGTAAFNMVWDGATWDRAPGTSVDGLLVNLGSNNDVTVTSGNIAVTGTVTANAGTNLNTSALLLEATFGRAQGSTTSGQTGPLEQAAVTTAAPSYTTAQTSPLSLTTTGHLRARDEADGATGSAVPTSAQAMGASDGTNTRIPRVFDTNTAGATEYTLGANIVVPNSGGGTQVGSATTDTGSTGLAVWRISKFVQATSPATTAVTCATTATAAPASARASRVTVTFQNPSTNTVAIYLGGSGVTTSTGIELLPGASFTDDVEDTPYFCRVASGTATLRVMEN